MIRFTCLSIRLLMLGSNKISLVSIRIIPAIGLSGVIFLAKWEITLVIKVSPKNPGSNIEI